MFAQSFSTFLYAKKFILQMKLVQKNAKINDVRERKHIQQNEQQQQYEMVREARAN